MGIEKTFRREYDSWRDAVRRCTIPTHPKWEYYGGRGITVCERWLHSFANFLADMGPMPSPKHTLERRDNMKGYERVSAEKKREMIELVT